MAITRMISINFWTDAKVDDEFTPEDKYFYLYLMTNPHTNICGCYEISKKSIERETGWTWDTINRLLGRMQNEHDVIRYDQETKEVLILNWGKYNWGKSPKVKSAVEKYANMVKNPMFKEYILNAIKSGDFNSGEVKQQEIKEAPTAAATQEEKPEQKRESFTEGWPTEEDVAVYVKEKGYEMNPRTFWFYQENRYWKDSNDKPIKDWKKYLDACEASGKFKSAI